MQKLLGITLFAILAGFSNTEVLADYVGPNSAPANIKQLQEVSWDHQLVTLKGHIVRRVSQDLYEFSDGSGTILLDVDDKHWHWPANTPVNEKTTVEIYGKYIHKVIGYTKIEVIDLRVVK